METIIVEAAHAGIMVGSQAYHQYRQGERNDVAIDQLQENITVLESVLSQSAFSPEIKSSLDKTLIEITHYIECYKNPSLTKSFMKAVRTDQVAENTAGHATHLSEVLLSTLFKVMASLDDSIRHIDQTTVDTQSAVIPLSQQLSALMRSLDQQVEKINTLLAPNERLRIDEQTFSENTVQQVRQLHQEFSLQLQEVLQNFTMSLRHYQESEMNHRLIQGSPVAEQEEILYAERVIAAQSQQTTMRTILGNKNETDVSTRNPSAHTETIRAFHQTAGSGSVTSNGGLPESIVRYAIEATQGSSADQKELIVGHHNLYRAQSPSSRELSSVAQQNHLSGEDNLRSESPDLR